MRCLNRHYDEKPFKQIGKNTKKYRKARKGNSLIKTTKITDVRELMDSTPDIIKDKQIFTLET